MSRIWIAIWFHGCSMGFISGILDGRSMISTSWFSRKPPVAWALGAGHYLGPERSCSGRWLLPRPETLLQCTSVHLSVHGAAQHKQLTFTAIVKSRPYNEMDWRHHLSSIHRDQCASHPATYAPKPIHLCDAWILTRKWKYNASGGCLKHDDVLPTEGGTADALKLV